MYGICKLSLIPVRADATSKSELITQLVLGDIYKIISISGEWIYIESLADNYIGWINNLQHSPLLNENLLEQKSFVMVEFPMILAFNQTLAQNQLIPFGASVWDIKTNAYSITFSVDGDLFSINKNTLASDTDLVKIASEFLNAPYLWGGRSALGIDCSGFTQIVFKSVGIHLKRDARQQAQEGDVVDFLSAAQAGDLAFFDNSEGDITHVGILISPSQIIHASGKVRIDNIDNHGIIHTETNNYSHKLRLIKRMK